MISQRCAVIAATIKVLNDRSIEFTKDIPISSVATHDIRAAVVDKVIEMFKSGEVSFRKTESNQHKMESDIALRKYVGGLVTDRWTKDTELNGGVKKKKNKTTNHAHGTAKSNMLVELEKLKLLCEDLDNEEAVAIVDEFIIKHQDSK